MGEPAFKKECLEIANNFIDATVNPLIKAARDGTEQDLKTSPEILEKLPRRLQDLEDSLGVETNVTSAHADMRDALQQFSQGLREAALKGDIQEVEKMITDAEKAINAYLDGEMEEININVSHSQMGRPDPEEERARNGQIAHDLNLIRADIAKAAPDLDDGTSREQIKEGFDTAHDEIHKLQRQMSEYKLEQQETAKPEESAPKIAS